MLRWFRKAPQHPRPVLAGHRVYAVGDIHGRADLLARLIEIIRNDMDTGPRPHEIALILLGDYIDRGRDSAAVLEALGALTLPGVSTTLLRGNHEQVLLDLLRAPQEELLRKWLTYGGLETLASYGVSSRLLYSEDADQILQALAQVFPPEHEAILQQTTLSMQVGDYFFVHAGIRPGRSVSDQTQSDMLWIREPFLSSTSDFGSVVVHGHSINLTVENRPNRIGVDTGAYATGVLTAVVLEEDQRRFLATRPAA